MDDDEDYEYEEDDYNYGSDEEGGQVEDDLIEIENCFYEGDDLKVENPSAAIEKFARSVELEKARGDDVKWRFKALQNLVVLQYQLGLFNESIARYREMLTYIHAVTRNECTGELL